jgi:hypothetical protein
MRQAIMIVAMMLILFSPVLIGCGPANTDPKPINIKEDPRIKRSGEGSQNKNETTVPPN